MPIHPSFVDSLEEVANLALGKIGEQAAISDIDTDTGSAAETVRRFIYQVIREVQSEFRWGELTASVELASPMAENDSTYQYTLPSDYLRPASNREQEYLIENGYLFTGTAVDFPFRYIRYSENPAEWSGLLVKCVYFRLALEICMPITENAQKYAALLEEYEKVVFPRARQVGSFDNESPRTRIARGTYSRTRSGIGSAIVSAFNRVIGVIAPGHNHDTDYMPLVATDKIATAFLQAGSVTAVKLAADALAVITDADAAVLADAKTYADEVSGAVQGLCEPATIASSFDVNGGYIKHGNGLIEQWGTLSIGGGSVTAVELPVAWPTSLLNASATFAVTSANIAESLGVSATVGSSLTHLDVRNGNGTARQVFWRAIGH